MRVMLVLIFLLAFLGCEESEHGNRDDKTIVKDPPVLPEFGPRAIEVNRWSVWIEPNGPWAYDGMTNYDQQVNLWGGVYIGAMKDGEASVSQIEHSQWDFIAGRILSSEPEPLESMEFSESAEYPVFLIDESQSKPDWDAWSDVGGPIQADRTPLLLSRTDSWQVYHDADVANHDPIDGNDGLGVEIEQQIFVFNDADLSHLDNIYYVYWRITNKTDRDYPNTLIGVWSDIDVNPSSELVGSDPAFRMVFTYNSVEFEGSDYASGISLLYASGLGGSRCVPYSMIWFRKQRLPWNAAERYNYLNGLYLDGSPLPGEHVDPESPRYEFSGDPVTGIGPVDAAPGDKHVMMSVGPFDFASGSTREIVFAVIGASSYDRVEAVRELRVNAGWAETFFNLELAGRIGLQE